METGLLLSNSKLHTSTLRTPSESRIIQRKNIEKRLENLSLKELQRICINLTKQNQRLKQEVQTFSQKIKTLIQSKKFDIQTKPNPQVQTQILKMKKQLQMRYDTLKDMKEQVKKQTNNNITQDTSNNVKNKKNQIKSIELEIETLQKQKIELKQTIKNNQIEFEQYLPAKDLSTQLQIFNGDNKLLKKKINNISLRMKDNQRTSKQALTKIYSLKKQGLTNQGTRIKRIKSFSVIGNTQRIKSGHQVNELKSLEQQIQQLKRKKSDVESELTSDKLTKLSQKQKKQQEITKMLEYHKKLFKRRVRGLTELNYLEKKQADIRAQKLLQRQRSSVPMLERPVQTQSFIRKEYRRDWIGKSQGLQFDDTELLQFKQSCLIKSLSVYRTTDRIVFIRFGYQHPVTNYRYETRTPFDKEALKKIQNKKVFSRNNGNLVNLILSVTKDIITRVESIWSDGDTFVQGWETQDSSTYSFDILEKQRPIAFYGTVVPHPKGFYALQSLGCQILQLQE